ncbi:glycosyltransferase family 2 protein [Marinicrinis sediminis]|uniref:Glycosyltransferase family 2 protein n=1 Tax=Marinicrinis sediminis TaxID=1652465 RepID=A0ABW5RE32_9BACL
MVSAHVVIPVHNQSLPLQLTLEGFTRQTISSSQFQITVVDDGSDVSVQEIVQPFTSKLPVQCMRLEERSGRARARNIGVEQGEADLLIFCDGDRIPRPDFMEAHLQTHRQKERPGLLVGQVRDLYLADLPTQLERARTSVVNQVHDRIPQYPSLVYGLFDEQGETHSPVAWIATLTGNLSMPTSLFSQLGGFDERFREWGFEHFEFGYRASQAKMPFYYEPRAINVHLAHRRDKDAYVQHLTESHTYFYGKHPDAAVKGLLPFMLGELTLSRFEKVAKGEEQDDQTIEKATHNRVRIQNF